MYLAYLSWPLYGTVAYIRSWTDGPIAGYWTGTISFKILMKYFNIFINYFKGRAIG